MSLLSCGTRLSTPRRFAGAGDCGSVGSMAVNGGPVERPARATTQRPATAEERGVMNVDDVESWIRLAAARVHDQAAALTALDQAIGDGDHGINLDRGFAAVVSSLDAADEAGARIGRLPDGSGDIAALLRHVGRTLVSTVGGASGPLYGTAFLRAAGAVAGRADLDGETAFIALRAAVDGVAALGKSGPGEKTMLDALIPAVEALESALARGEDAPSALVGAATAAESGRDATIPMLATKGRASYLGERSVGHQDPGATSSALLLRALADAVHK